MPSNSAADSYVSKLTTAEKAPASIATGETVSCGMAIGLRRNVYFGPDYHEGVDAFLESASRDFRGRDAGDG